MNSIKEYPPNSIFNDLDECYDGSVVGYLMILRWMAILMLLFGLLSVPNLVLCIMGDVLPSSYFEVITAANVKDTELTYIVVVICDALGTLIILLGVYYLRYWISIQSQWDVDTVKDWSVELSGFPASTIDSEDLRSLMQGMNVREISLARDYKGTLQLHKQKVDLERQIMVETRRLQIQNSKLTQEQIYQRQQQISLLREQLDLKQSEIALDLNVYLSGDDLNSIRAFIVFESKNDRNAFYNRYNYNCCFRYNCLTSCVEQPDSLKLRSIYTIQVNDAPDPSEIQWQNMDYIDHHKCQYLIISFLIVIALLCPLFIFMFVLHHYAQQDPSLHKPSPPDQTRNGIMFTLGTCIAITNAISTQLLMHALTRERNLYIIQEQLTIYYRIILFFTINTFLIPILLSFTFYSITPALTIISPIPSLYQYELNNQNTIYSTDLDRKWIINTAPIFIWLNFINIFIIILTPLITITKQSQLTYTQLELQLIANILDQSQSDQDQSISQNNFFLDESIALNRSNILERTLFSKIKPIRPDSPLINFNPPFNTGHRYATILFVISISLVFASPLPILPLLGALQLGLLYYSDKYLLLQYHSYHEKQGLRLQKELTTLGIKFLKSVPIVLIIHLFFALMTFGSPYFFNQSTLGYLDSNWKFDQTAFLLPYKAAKVVPITLLLFLILLLSMADSIFCGTNYRKQTNYKQVGADKNEDQSIFEKMIQQDLLVSYDLIQNDAYADILKSQKKESIRATLNKFKI